MVAALVLLIAVIIACISFRRVVKNKGTDENISNTVWLILVMVKMIAECLRRKKSKERNCCHFLTSGFHSLEIPFSQSLSPSHLFIFSINGNVTSEIDKLSYPKLYYIKLR